MVVPATPESVRKADFRVEKMESYVKEHLQKLVYIKQKPANEERKLCFGEAVQSFDMVLQQGWEDVLRIYESLRSDFELVSGTSLQRCNALEQTSNSIKANDTTSLPISECHAIHRDTKGGASYGSPARMARPQWLLLPLIFLNSLFLLSVYHPAVMSYIDVAFSYTGFLRPQFSWLWTFAQHRYLTTHAWILEALLISCWALASVISRLGSRSIGSLLIELGVNSKIQSVLVVPSISVLTTSCGERRFDAIVLTKYFDSLREWNLLDSKAKRRILLDDIIGSLNEKGRVLIVIDSIQHRTVCRQLEQELMNLSFVHCRRLYPSCLQNAAESRTISLLEISM
eukprot:GILK01007633.1.p1 GENE.GILK01007633.1~~GILK01007633.1.p1  ORF type:complete len:342 (+),score=29.44 GILK01007633.1:39-1064(+)